MTPRARITTVIVLSICLAMPAWGQQQLLYTPQPVTSGQKITPQDGILVQEVEVQSGDSLYKLSRKFSGRGMYFPQILLFNTIKNPNLIHTGDTLKIPVTQKVEHVSGHNETTSTGAVHKPKISVDKNKSLKSEVPPTASQSNNKTSTVSGSSTELSLSDLKTVRTEKKRAGNIKKRTAGRATHKSVAAAVPAAKAADGQRLFEAAVKAYRKEDCRTALELLDRYLAENPGSPLAADANLYKAECYLKLSVQ